MKKWKFLLLGITGDLSHRKILPALAQFAELNKEKFEIELIGYSRSKPNLTEILEILNKNTSTGSTYITKISDYQGEYTDKSKLDEIINSLSPDERLVLYLAIPPYLILSILNNLKEYQYTEKHFDVLIEKPFGQSKEEAEKILGIIGNGDFETKLHFLDHALFKSAIISGGWEIGNREELRQSRIQSINIRWIEELGVEGRGGYYDESGAIKDMLSSHLYAILYKTLEKLGYSNSKINENTYLSEVEIGQYENYLKDVEKDQSNTESYFKVKSNLRLKSLNFPNYQCEVIFESGKLLGIKETSVLVEFEDKSAVSLNINSSNDKPSLIIKTSQGDEVVDLSKDIKNEHVNAFESLISGNNENFTTPDMVIEGWEIHDKVKQFIESNEVQVKKYKNNKYPTEFIS